MNQKKCKRLRRQVVALDLAPREYVWADQRPNPAKPHAQKVSIACTSQSGRAVYQRIKAALKKAKP